MEKTLKTLDTKNKGDTPVFSGSSADDLCGRLFKESALHLSKLEGVVALFTFGNIDLKSLLDLDIPVIDITQIKTIIEKLPYFQNENPFQIQDLSETLRAEADKNTSLLMNAAAVEYSLGNIEGGIVLGLIRTQNSYSLVAHNMDENETVLILRECEKRVTPETFRNVLHLSLNIALNGREGKKVGTAFIIGDEKEVLERSHQMILNPFRSTDPGFEINVNKKENWETVMGFAQLDGVFILSGTGKVLSAGRYLDVDTRDIPIEKGFGTRHLSSASITRDTNAIAVAISESGGTIRVYMDGKEIIFVEPDSALTFRTLNQI